MPQTFGKYQLIEKIGEGGMAEVYLAKQLGDLAGFEKKVALKRIFPHLTDREDLVVMFLDEARISAQLNHANIVQIYDLGKVDDTLYIAMEYIHGNDLRRICEEGIEHDDFISRELAARIVAEAAAGLHYAHTSTDENGQPRNIVHRDVSPQNIMVSMEGQVKVADFGVAKAEDRLGKTRSGQRKGKLSYMSPEQFESSKVDARSDVYTLGIVLYETTVGKRLFRGRSDFETMNLVANAEVTPPSEEREGFDPGLEAIIMKALQKDPDERYQSAQEMQLALEDWLHDQDKRAGRVELAAYMSQIFPDGVGVSAVDDAGELDGVGELTSPTAPMNDVDAVSDAGPAQPAQPAQPTQPAQPAHRPPPQAGPPAASRPGPPGASGGPAQPAHPAQQAQPDPQPDLQADGGWDVGGSGEADDFDDYGDFTNKRSQLFAGLGAVGVVLAIGIIAYMMLNTELMTEEEKAEAKAKIAALQAIEEGGVEVPDPPEFVEVSLTTEPEGAWVVVNGLLDEAKTPTNASLVAGGPNEVTFYHPQYPPRRVIVDGEAGAASEPVKLLPFDAEPEIGTLIIESRPRAGIVYVDGERLGAAPQTLENVAAGFEHHVEVRKSGHYRSAGFFQIVAGETNDFEISLAPKDSAGRKKYVEVTYDAIPKEKTAVTIDGEPKGSSKLVLNQTRNTFVHAELAAPGYHTQDRYLLLHDVGTFRLRTFLEQKKREKGSLTVEVLPEDAQIYIGSNAYDSNPVKNLKLYEGEHTVVIEMPGHRQEGRVTVYPGRKNSYKLDATGSDLKIERLD